MANPIYRKRAKQFGSIDFSQQGVWQQIQLRCPLCHNEASVETEINLEQMGGVSRQKVACLMCGETFYFSYEIEISTTLEQ